MRLQLKVSAYHLMDGLGTGLYEDEGQRVIELVRNGAVASMPSTKWDPTKAKIEITLVPSHPLSPHQGPALIVLDHGSGMTDEAIDRYFNWIGPSLSQLKKSKNGYDSGASQKGIGRLAALALNANCLRGDILLRIKHGYYLFSRTSVTGEIRYVPFIPEKAESESGLEVDRFISPTSTELGPLRGIQGSFTAIVIPTPIFSNHTEIVDVLKWFLPRERDKMFELLVGGKKVLPPPLQDSVNTTSTDGRFRARLGLGDEKSDGVWLCDSETGFRVASCRKMGRTYLPDPLWYPELTGDIFAPGLLRHQNTARSTLNKEYTRKNNAEWARLHAFLWGTVAPSAKKLFERDAIDGDAAATLDEVAQMFNDLYGDPDEAEPKSPTAKPREGSETPRPREPKLKNSGDEEKPERQYRRYISIKVSDAVYYLYRGQSLHPHIYAQVDTGNDKIIFVNVRGGYQALPAKKEARQEHCLMQLLSAIGKSEWPDDPYQAMIRANELRSEFPK